MFTTWSKEVKFDPHLSINNSPIPVKSKVKVLGVTFNSLLHFGEYVRCTKEKLQKRNSILKMIASSDGLHKRLSVTYKAIDRSVLNYGALIWASTISNTNWNHPQTQQNLALRVITGCVKISDINDLHKGDEVLPVKAHIEILAEQFLAGSYQSHRADQETTCLTSFRPMGPILNDTYRDRVKQHKNNYVAKNTKMHSKYPRAHDTYSIEQRQQVTSYTSTKDSRRTNAATNCTYPTSTTENWMLSPAKLLLE